MAKKRKKSTAKTEVVYGDVKPKYNFNKEEVKKEISDLEMKKQKAQEGKKGFSKFFAGASYTKAIKERRAKLGRSDTIGNIRQQIELEKAKRELESVRPKRVNFENQRQISVEGLGGSSSLGKTVKFEDLF